MEKVSFGEGISGYVVGPSGAPGVIVLQEWWGITQEIKQQAEKISLKGYRCLVPDLYKGKLGVDAEEAQHLMTSLDWKAAIDEIKSAAKYLKDTGSPKVGATGFCMGGALTLIGLQHSEDICCGAPFYGTPGAELCDPEKITKPVQAHFGSLDTMAGFSDPEAAKNLEEKLAKSGNGDFEVFSYDNVGHAFMNNEPDQPQIKQGLTFNTGFPKAVEDVQSTAWSRLFCFFEKHLQKKHEL
eukprot:CAMPEP_0198234764 /NCGR_PEP_ID=MMETSP1446-20131203/684_1 /TAXON_ID=1461542 ORGANISM="Unidentified sp, Strain CCMP2111" /NCGR_SAMPLE_ID=MMETSP1446 /ASSEMBLY_ACC=CAM_ASM_001112 /LENGTH=239 /DNA_ID=CAMNT_0043915585 /DNA_START=210 /DNA_END=929 /DNA_ORIENTATION=-